MFTSLALALEDIEQSGGLSIGATIYYEGEEALHKKTVAFMF